MEGWLGLGLPVGLVVAAVMHANLLFPSASAPLPYELTPAAPYVDLFVRAGMTRGFWFDTTRLFFAFMEDEELEPDDQPACQQPVHIIGYCHQTGGFAVVLLDRVYWERAHFGRRAALVFHELGHCLLERAHADQFDCSGTTCVPASLMHSGEEMGEVLAARWHQYLDEMFDFGPDQQL